jgi:hypothetical protein
MGKDGKILSKTNLGMVLAAWFISVLGGIQW